jgi:hypothetical protein
MHLRNIALALNGEVVGAQVVAPGPRHSRRDRSLTIRLSPSAPDGLLVFSHAGDDWRDCRDYVRERLGIDPNGWKTRPAPARPQQAPPDNDSTDCIGAAARVWDDSEPITEDDAGWRYLVRRGIIIDAVPDHGGLRFHPRCPWGTTTTQCIVARYTDAVTGEPRGIWRRPVSGEKPRSLGPHKGCVIRLWPDEDVALGIVLGEGIETTLSAATRITHKGTLLQPAWAAGNAANMAAFPPLNGIESITLLVDNDEASHTGEKVSEACARAWVNAGKEVLRLMPTLPGDFNDLVKS